MLECEELTAAQALEVALALVHGVHMALKAPVGRELFVALRALVSLFVKMLVLRMALETLARGKVLGAFGALERLAQAACAALG
mmetsp:Transcript_5755/g.11801  ORF Transcript_5755/g.11801 Transcript_5755/m.11801 type:complete len:84 (+) Transcript_5755:1646-1897(+)